MRLRCSFVIDRDDELRDRAAQAADRLTEWVTDPPPVRSDDDLGPRSRRWWDQSLSKGAAGVAVLHGMRARHDLVHAWLARATHEDISAAPGCGLWFGAPAMAFAVYVAAPGRYTGAMAALHTTVLRIVDARLAAAEARLAAAVRPSRSEFDLVRGLTGLGAYLLVREPDGAPLRRILDHHVRLTEPVHARDAGGRRVPGWWTRDVPRSVDGEDVTHGHADLGMAHGITGPLALLALAMRGGTIVPGHAEAIERICAWLDSRRCNAPAGDWWPQRLTLAEERAGASSRPGPDRPSWCYGTPGVARALQLAGSALGDDARQAAAEQALLRCVTDPAQLARLDGPTMCHGWAGVVTAVRCAARDSRTTGLGDALPQLVDILIAKVVAEPPVDLPVGLVDGTAGIALALHGAPAEPVGRWATCLLLR